MGAAAGRLAVAVVGWFGWGPGVAASWYPPLAMTGNSSHPGDRRQLQGADFSRRLVSVEYLHGATRSEGFIQPFMSYRSNANLRRHIANLLAMSLIIFHNIVMQQHTNGCTMSLRHRLAFLLEHEHTIGPHVMYIRDTPSVSCSIDRPSNSRHHL